MDSNSDGDSDALRWLLWYQPERIKRERVNRETERKRVVQRPTGGGVGTREGM